MMMRAWLCPTASGEQAKEISWHCQLEFAPQNLWVGAVWERAGNCVDVYVCLIPCVTIHLSYWWHDPVQ